VLAFWRNLKVRTPMKRRAIPGIITSNPKIAKHDCPPANRWEVLITCSFAWDRHCNLFSDLFFFPKYRHEDINHCQSINVIIRYQVVRSHVSNKSPGATGLHPQREKRRVKTAGGTRRIRRATAHMRLRWQRGGQVFVGRSIGSKRSLRRWRVITFIDQVNSDEGDSVGQLSPANYPTQGRQRKLSQ
jgi:hypothetical protein